MLVYTSFGFGQVLEPNLVAIFFLGPFFPGCLCYISRLCLWRLWLTSFINQSIVIRVCHT